MKKMTKWALPLSLLMMVGVSSGAMDASAKTVNNDAAKQTSVSNNDWQYNKAYNWVKVYKYSTNNPIQVKKFTKAELDKYLASLYGDHKRPSGSNNGQSNNTGSDKDQSNNNGSNNGQSNNTGSDKDQSNNNGSNNGQSNNTGSDKDQSNNNGSNNGQSNNTGSDKDQSNNNGSNNGQSNNNGSDKDQSNNNGSNNGQSNNNESDKDQSNNNGSNNGQSNNTGSDKDQSNNNNSNNGSSNNNGSNNGSTNNGSNDSNNSSVSQFEQQVITLTNAERAKEGLSALKADTKLMQSAKAKSDDMAKNNYFSHTSPTYGSPFDQMKSLGISYKAAAENIAQGQKTPQEVVQAWMQSPGHRANIMNGSYTHIGVGYTENGNYWTQQFIQK